MKIGGGEKGKEQGAWSKEAVSVLSWQEAETPSYALTLSLSYKGRWPGAPQRA